MIRAAALVALGLAAWAPRADAGCAYKPDGYDGKSPHNAANEAEQAALRDFMAQSRLESRQLEAVEREKRHEVEDPLGANGRSTTGHVIRDHADFNDLTAPAYEQGVYNAAGEQSEGQRCRVPGELWLDPNSATCYGGNSVDYYQPDLNEYHSNVALGGRFGYYDNSAADTQYHGYGRCAGRPDCNGGTAGTREYQSFDGFYNNANNPALGSADQVMLRKVPVAYRDGAYHPTSNQVDLNANIGGAEGVGINNKCIGSCGAFTVHAAESVPNARQIPLETMEGFTGESSARQSTGLFIFFGQLLIEEVLDAQRPNCLPEYTNVPIDPTNIKWARDPVYGEAYSETGNRFYVQRARASVSNTGYAPGTPLMFLNEVSAYIDGTLFYGPFKAWADGLRTFRCTTGAGGDCGELAEDDGICRSGAGKRPSSGGCGSGPGFGRLNNIGFPIANPPVPYYKGTYQDESKPDEVLFQGQVRNISRQYLAGNPRANENAFGVSLAHIWHRHHNWWAKRFTAFELYEGNHVTDEEIFLEARKWNIATYQHVVYSEWLPQMLNRPLAVYTGYNDVTDPQISNIFQSAAGRYGHTQVTPGGYVRDSSGEFKWINADGSQDAFDRTLPYLDSNGVNRYRAASTNSFRAIRTCNSMLRPRSHVDQRTTSTTPEAQLLRGAQADEIMMGLASQITELEDNIITPDLRGFVLGSLSSSRRDLMAINIMRGRDHGLPDYNTARAHYGLAQRRTFDDICAGINPNCARVASGLRRVYGQRAAGKDAQPWSVQVACQPDAAECDYVDNIDAVDVWPGGILETNAYHGHPGELFRTIMLEQWSRIRSADRFWYENPNNGLFSTRWEIDDELRQYNGLRFQRPREAAAHHDAAAPAAGHGRRQAEPHGADAGSGSSSGTSAAAASGADAARPVCRILACYDTRDSSFQAPYAGDSGFERVSAEGVANQQCGYNGNPDYGPVGYTTDSCPGGLVRTGSDTIDQDGNAWFTNSWNGAKVSVNPTLALGDTMVGMTPCHDAAGLAIPDKCYPWPGTVDAADPVAVNTWLSANRGHDLRPVDSDLSTNCTVVCDRRNLNAALEASSYDGSGLDAFHARASPAGNGQYDTIGGNGQDRTPMPFYPSNKGIRVSDVMRRVLNPHKRWHGFSIQDDAFSGIRIQEQLGTQFLQPKQMSACNQTADFMGTHMPSVFADNQGVRLSTGSSKCNAAGRRAGETNAYPQLCNPGAASPQHQERVIGTEQPDGSFVSLCPVGYEERDLEDCTPPQTYDWYAQSGPDLPLIVGLGVFLGFIVICMVMCLCIKMGKAKKNAQLREMKHRAALATTKKDPSKGSQVAAAAKMLKAKRASQIQLDGAHTEFQCSSMASLTDGASQHAVRIRVHDEIIEILNGVGDEGHGNLTEVGKSRVEHSHSNTADDGAERTISVGEIVKISVVGSVVQLKVKNSYDMLLHFDNSGDAGVFAHAMVEDQLAATSVDFADDTESLNVFTAEQHFGEIDKYLTAVVNAASSNRNPSRDKRLDDILLSKGEVNSLLKLTSAKQRTKDFSTLKSQDAHFGDTLFRVAHRTESTVVNSCGIPKLEVRHIVDFLSKLMNLSDATEQDLLLFNMIDVDGSGSLDVEEMEGFHSHTKEELHKVLEKAGVSPGALIDFAGFQRIMNQTDDVYSHRRGGDTGKTHELQHTPFHDYYVENVLNIFWLVIITIFNGGLFAERAYYYAVETEAHGGLRRALGYGVTVTRGSAQSVSFCYVMILLPMCRNTITALRSTYLAKLIPFDEAIKLHKFLAYNGAFFTLVHIIGHVVNFYHISNMPAGDASCHFQEVVISSTFLPYMSWWLFHTVTGETGFWCLLVTMILFAFAVPTKSRQNNFNAFWATHHLYVVFYALIMLHGCAQIVQEPYFPYWFMPAGFWFAFDKAVSVAKGSTAMTLKKVLLHPSNVTELCLKRPASFVYRSGQWARLKILQVSKKEWHPFTISSAPGEDHLGFHIRSVGPWTRKMRLVFQDALASHKGLPLVNVEGPYGEDHQSWWKHETIILVGAGIGVTPFLSIIKDIVLSVNHGDEIITNSVYFAWVTPNLSQYEWCLDIIRAIEANPAVSTVLNFKAHIFISQIKVNTDFRTAMYAVTETRFYKLLGKSLLTGLKAESHFGRPNWLAFFEQILTSKPGAVGHAGEDVTVFSCCSPPIRKAIDQARHTYISRATTNHANSLEHITSNF